MRIFDILGHIVPDDDAWIYRWFGFSVTSPADIRKALKAAGKEPVTVRINSYGGDAWSASDMYTLLRGHEPGVETVVTGLAASAATLPMTAGNTVRASPTAEIMIHNPSCRAQGDHRALEHAASSLRNTREAIINAYELKTGLSRERLRGMLNSETWMTAQSARAAGFVDEILFVGNDDLELEQPEEAASAGASAAKTAALNLPSAELLKERWAVWNELAPGASNIDEARAMIAGKAAQEAPAQEARAMIAGKAAQEAPAQEPQQIAEESNEDQKADQLHKALLMARISALAT